MTEQRAFKVGDVISMEEALEGFNKFTSGLVWDTTDNHTAFVEKALRYREQIKLKIVELPEVD